MNSYNSYEAKNFTDNLSLSYFDISWLSRYDGPGHRVVLYLQGCHLKCPWCHSPHSQPTVPPLLYFPAKCHLCGNCEKACTQGVHEVINGNHHIYRDRCIGCGKCIDACPASHRERISGAIALAGKELPVTELWRILYPQLDLLRPIGGLTVSGGEALLQSRALAALLQCCKQENIHTAVETSGALSSKYVKEIAPLTDCWLYGLRPTPFYTPPFAEQIAINLAFLAKTASRIIIRTPIIAGITDQLVSLKQIAELMEKNGVHEIQLLPFNRETPHYYHALGQECQVGNEARVSHDRMETVRSFFEKRNLKPTIIQ